MQRQKNQRDRTLLFPVLAVLLASVWRTPPLVHAQGGLSENERQQAEAQAAIIAAEELYDHGDHDKALAQWREATRIDPKYPAPYVNLGEALENKGDTKGAIAAYERFLELTPTAPAATSVREQIATLKATSKN